MQTILIKKYKNRRLYDTKKSQYITVDDLQRYVLEGIGFSVEDATTGQDITSTTLLQILVEMEAGATPFLSAEVLKQLIILAQHPLSKSYKEMLQQMMLTMDAYIKNNTYISNYQTTIDAWTNNMNHFFRG
jgi:polyhydroxyalkanoate synthesis repressor PhaR